MLTQTGCSLLGKLAGLPARPSSNCLHGWCPLQDAEKAAKKLTDEAYCRGSNDNISCIVVRFNF